MYSYLKIELVVFAYELFIIFLLLGYVTSDIQPSTAIVNQLPVQLVTTEIS